MPAVAVEAGQRGAQALRELERAPRASVREDDGELVAADAVGLICAAHRRAERVGERADALVAGLVALRVVERLEVVEVDQRQGQRQAGAPGVLQLAREVLMKDAVVAQARERVRAGHLGQARRPRRRARRRAAGRSARRWRRRTRAARARRATAREIARFARASSCAARRSGRARGRSRRPPGGRRRLRGSRRPGRSAAWSKASTRSWSLSSTASKSAWLALCSRPGGAGGGHGCLVPRASRRARAVVEVADQAPLGLTVGDYTA